MRHSATMRFDDVAERLARLPAHLPPPPADLIPVLLGGGGRSGQATPLRPPPEPANAVPAATLVLIHPDEDGAARVVLTERADRGGHHSGEVSFPGGKAEPGDADLETTALREAAEEVGLDPVAAEVTILRRLDWFWIPVSGYRVTPVVALAARDPDLTPQPSEVARILRPPMTAFVPGAPFLIVERTIREQPVRYGAYPIEDLLVWGATARVLSQLGRWLADGERG